MALSASPAPRTRVRVSHSISSDRRTVTKLVTAFVLARIFVLVLMGKASVTVSCLRPDHDQISHRCTTSRRLDVVVAPPSASTAVSPTSW